MSFTQEVKSELINLDMEEIALISSLSAIIANSLANDKIKIITENSQIAKYIFIQIKKIFKISPKIVVRNGYNYNKKNLYILEISNDLTRLKEILGISKNIIPDIYILDDELSKRAYIAGVFLMTGSINDPKKSRYHLEFIFDNEEYATFFSNLVNEYYLSSKVIKRENKFMVYIKEAEKIADFLRLISTFQSLLYYEDIRIYRDNKNMINRLNNCEQANVDKMIETATMQVNDIEYIKENGCFELLDDKVKEAANYRLKYPESSLNELSEIISFETNKLLTKSGLNHRLKKIKDLANKLRKK